MKKYLFVINPVSGGTDKSRLIQDIHHRCEKYSIQPIIHRTNGKDDLRKVDEALTNHQPEKVIIGGGDGTINEMLPVLLKHRIAVGIIPIGSANGLARELGLQLSNALDCIFAGHKKGVDVISINDHLMIHMADIGLNATLIKRYEAEDRRGFLGYAISALKELPSLDESFHVTLDFGDQQKELETKFLVIANARMYGTGYEVNPVGNISDQQVEICAMKELSAALIAEDLFLNNPEEKYHDLFHIYSGNTCSIKCEKPIDFQIDGEYLGTTDELQICVLPEQLTIMT